MLMTIYICIYIYIFFFNYTNYLQWAKKILSYIHGIIIIPSQL